MTVTSCIEGRRRVAVMDEYIVAHQRHAVPLVPHEVRHGSPPTCLARRSKVTKAVTPRVGPIAINFQVLYDVPKCSAVHCETEQGGPSGIAYDLAFWRRLVQTSARPLTILA
jgi:hypothetical protein